MVGIKGTGMAALCELLIRRGARVRGSDSSEVFYTDAILSRLGAGVIEDFSASVLPERLDLVVHSAAYDPGSHPQLRAARERGLPILSYTEALGALSRGRPAVAVAGVHGKTTTTAMIGSIVRSADLAGEVLVGSAVSVFDGFSTFFGGVDFLVAETCEYRRNFLSFDPSVLVVTSIEADHLDYYRDEEDVFSAFLEFAGKLPEGGVLIYCADDAGASRLAETMGSRRPDLSLLPYGRGAEGRYGVREVRPGEGRTLFRLVGIDQDFSLRVPGDHNVLNAAAAIAATEAISGGEGVAARDAADLAAGIAAFAGTRRRSEIIGEAGGILFLDDYGHHPTAIASTLAGLRQFYPGRRLVVSFMSHTYSRTAGLLEDFARSFGDADVVVAHKIYASAREAYDGQVSGKSLAEAIARHHDHVRYIPEVADAEDVLPRELRAGDIFLTLGAGNNWVLSHRLYETARKEEAQA